VEGLKGQDLRGGIALWSYQGEEAYFSNRITNSSPLPVKNGSDASGKWEVKVSSDAGMFGGTLQLGRDGSKLTGTWSGDLGNARPVTGTWRADSRVQLQRAMAKPRPWRCGNWYRKARWLDRWRFCWRTHESGRPSRRPMDGNAQTVANRGTRPLARACYVWQKEDVYALGNRERCSSRRSAGQHDRTDGLHTFALRSVDKKILREYAC
jgi:hypothetical protein